MTTCVRSLTPKALSRAAVKKQIRCLSREQENHETEIKLRRMMMDLHEKRSELIIAMTARKLQCLTDQLVGAQSVKTDREVEKNEYNMFIDITNELRELNYDLIDYLCGCNINE